jgi:Domain of unknown function (DUF5642)
MLRVVLALATACCLAACSSGAAKSSKVEIARVSEVKSSFGPEFKVTDISERAIDPQFFASRKLPDGLTFDPPSCAKVAGAPEMPAGVQGNMAAVSAEGNGLRFVVIAVETSAPLPSNDPGRDCKRVTFSGPQLRGGLEVVDAPKIEGAHTDGVHRVLQALVGGTAHAGELYDYSAQFDDYQVIVIANPLVIPGQQVAAVDTQRARDLLVKAVAAVRP